MKRLLLVLYAFAVTAALHAEVKTQTVTYKDGKEKLIGFLAYDTAGAAKKPGVLVTPEWWGLNEYAKSRAQQLAELGYVALAVDVYGNGKTTTDMKEAGTLAGKFKGDRNLMRARMKAALSELLRQQNVDPSRVAAIGYCFGGTAALELARAGADLKGAVSFHGGLETPLPAQPGQMKAEVLVLHGADDAFVKAEELNGFINEMKNANAKYQVNIYSGAVHAFTNPKAGNDPAKGMAYDERADRRSWEAMRAFFTEVLK